VNESNYHGWKVPKTICVINIRSSRWFKLENTTIYGPLNIPNQKLRKLKGQYNTFDFGPLLVVSYHWDPERKVLVSAAVANLEVKEGCLGHEFTGAFKGRDLGWHDTHTKAKRLICGEIFDHAYPDSSLVGGAKVWRGGFLPRTRRIFKMQSDEPNA
jgi:hypothetical protein